MVFDRRFYRGTCAGWPHCLLTRRGRTGFHRSYFIPPLIASLSSLALTAHIPRRQASFGASLHSLKAETRNYIPEIDHGTLTHRQGDGAVGGAGRHRERPGAALQVVQARCMDGVLGPTLLHSCACPVSRSREAGYGSSRLDILLTCASLTLDPDLHRLGARGAVHPAGHHHHAAKLHVVRLSHHQLSRRLRHHTHLKPGKNTSSKPTHPQPPRSPPQRTSPAIRNGNQAHHSTTYCSA